MNLMEYWDGGLAGAVILSGLVIVFIALILLIVIVQSSGRLIGDKQSAAISAPAPKAAPKAVPKAPPAPPAPKTAPAAPVPPVVQPGIAQETVAAISAAVAAFMDEEAPGMEYAVTSIQRSGGNRMSRPVWGFAAMQQNTRPF